MPDESKFCIKCGLNAVSQLGEAKRPGKSIGLMCEMCWEKARRSLERGHGYSWTPFIEQSHRAEMIPALSLWNPWAVLYAHGSKRVETRGWSLYGKLPRTFAVHSTKSFTRACRLKLGYHSWRQLPVGCVLGLVTITRSYRFNNPADIPPEPEFSFGDYSWGRWGFVSENFRPFKTPIPASGGQKVWHWEPPAELVFADGTPAIRPQEQTLFTGAQR